MTEKTGELLKRAIHESGEEGKRCWDRLSNPERNCIVGEVILHLESCQEDTPNVPCPDFVSTWDAAHLVMDAVFLQRMRVRDVFWMQVQRLVCADMLQEKGYMLAWPHAYEYMTPDSVCYAALVAWGYCR